MAQPIRSRVSATGSVAPLAFAGHKGILSVALSEIDRNLLERCLHRKPRAWEDFVDRFMGLVVHVVQHTAQARSIQLLPQDRDDLCAEVFLNIVKDDFAILRHFRGKSSLATYLTIVARRIVVKKLLRGETAGRLATVNAPAAAQQVADGQPKPEARLSNQEEVQQLLDALEGNEADVVRMYHMEGKSYHEISSVTGMPENTIGPMLSRARGKLRRNGVKPST